MAKDSVNGKNSIFTFADEVISVETYGNISYYRTDEKHSVTDILDEVGKEQVTIEYDEYGVIKNPEVVSTSGNIFAYTGHVYEESTGLYYAKARYYDVEIGRFVSEDSYQGNPRNPSTLNSYTYANQNPYMYMDPSGHILVRVVAKLGTGALFDMGMQLVANYFFNSKTAGNFKASFDKINWGQVFVSGVENLFDYKNKALTAAVTGLGDVIVSWMKQGKKYSCEKALRDFAMGFLSDIAARYVCKFGAKAVSKGMEKMGVNPAKIKKLTGIDISGSEVNKSVSRTTKNIKNIIFDNKQVGKKWGEHMKDYPNLKNYSEYKNYANKVFKNYDKKVFDKVKNEWYYIKGKDLLRLKSDGTFISLYPGADSPRVINLN